MTAQSASLHPIDGANCPRLSANSFVVCSAASSAKASGARRRSSEFEGGNNGNFTADFKNGMCIMYNNKMCTIIEFQHVKPGKGGAFVRMKLRDIKTGRVLSDTVNAGVKFDTVRLEQREMTYLYNDGSDFFIMDPNSYEQFSLPTDHVWRCRSVA